MTGRELVAGSRLRPQPRLSTGDIERHFSVLQHGQRIQHLTRHTSRGSLPAVGNARKLP